MILARVATAAIGVWLMAAPAITGTDRPESTSMHVTGPIVVALSLAAAAPALESLRWLLMAAGGWLVVAPWVLGADARGAATSVVAGALVIVLAGPQRRRAARRGGRWHALVPLVRPASRAGDTHDA